MVEANAGELEVSVKCNGMLLPTSAKTDFAKHFLEVIIRLCELSDESFQYLCRISLLLQLVMTLHCHLPSEYLNDVTCYGLTPR